MKHSQKMVLIPAEKYQNLLENTTEAKTSTKDTAVGVQSSPSPIPPAATKDVASNLREPALTPATSSTTTKDIPLQQQQQQQPEQPLTTTTTTTTSRDINKTPSVPERLQGTKGIQKVKKQKKLKNSPPGIRNTTLKVNKDNKRNKKAVTWLKFY